MVILRNIRKNDKTISCNYYHEDESESFEMVYDYRSGTLLKATDPSEGGYTYHARRKLERLSRMDNPPSSAREMWY